MSEVRPRQIIVLVVFGLVLLNFAISVAERKQDLGIFLTLVALFAAIFLTERWVAAHPRHAVSVALFRWRVVSTGTVVLIAVVLLSVSFATTLISDRLHLGNALLAGFAFMTVFGSLMAFAAALIRGFQAMARPLRKKILDNRRARS